MSDTRHSRRDFLRGTTTAAAGIALASGLNISRAAHAAGSEQLKVALIGCGGRGTGAAHDCLGASEDVKIIAVADAFEDQATVAAKTLNKTFKESGKADITPDRTFVGFDAYQKAIDCGVDLVILTTPPGFRPIHYTAAINAGKHVFMEKPCCTDAPGYRMLLKANEMADAKNLKVGVGLQRHHKGGYLEGIKRIRDGQIGDVQFLRVYWNGNTPWVRPRQAGQSEMEYQMRNWYYFVWLCGDHICEQHVHNLDVANWVKGDHPIEANGMGGRQVRRGKEYGHIFDHHTVEYTYKDGTKLFSQCRQMPGTWTIGAEIAHGTKGSLDLLVKLKKDNNEMHQEHADLVNAIRKDEKYNEGWYGAHSSMTAILGRMATYSGQVVRWDDAVANGPDEMPGKFAMDAMPKILPDKDGSYEHAVAVPGIFKPY